MQGNFELDIVSGSGVGHGTPNFDALSERSNYRRDSQSTIAGPRSCASVALRRRLLRQGVMHVVKKLTSHRFCALLFALGVNSVTVYQGISNIQLTHNIEPVEDQCWNSVGDGGPQ